VVFHGDAAPLREGRFERWEVLRIRPVAFVRSSQDLKDLKYLVDLAVTCE